MSSNRNVGMKVGRPPDPRHVQACQEIEHTHLVGVEIEVAGHRPNPFVEYLRYWTTHRDGSIRGRHAVEFVFAVPLGGTDVLAALREWQTYVTNHQPLLEVNPSCSFHVHLDVRDLDTTQLTKLVMLYLALERGLYHFVGGDRKANPFSAPLYSIDDMISDLETDVSGEWVTRTVNFGRYAGLNLGAVSRYGSVEFRHHRGTLDIDEMVQWINIVGKFKDFALNEMAPDDILQVASASGYPELTARVLGKYAPLFNYQGASHDMFLGLRVAQDFLYRNNTKRTSTIHQQEVAFATSLDEGTVAVEPASSGYALVPPKMRKVGGSKSKKKVTRRDLEEMSLEEVVRSTIAPTQEQIQMEYRGGADAPPRHTTTWYEEP